MLDGDDWLTPKSPRKTDDAGGRGKAGDVWLSLALIVFGSLGALVGITSTVESFRQEAATAEVVALEHVDSSSWPRARVRFTVPDGRVVTPLVTKHHEKLQPGRHVEIRYDPGDPEAAVEYDRLGGWGGVFALSIGVFLAVVGATVLRKDLAARRRDG